MTVCVIGAGVTGLATAYALRRLGVAVRIYEGQEHEGGLASTVVRDGFRFDFGPHELDLGRQRVRSLVQEVCASSLIPVQKRTAQFLDGRYVEYPFSFSSLRATNPLSLARTACDVISARASRWMRPTEDDSFASWTRSRFGSRLYDSYFGPYTRKVWGRDPRELDARAASQRIAVESVRELVKKTLSFGLMRRCSSRGGHDEFQREFIHTRGGIGTLQKTLLRKTKELGAEIAFGKRLERVDIKGQRMTSLVFEDGTREDDVTHVVSTIPLPRLVQIALPNKAASLLEKNSLPYRGMAFVFVGIKRPSVTNYHWTYFPDPAIPFQRLSEFSHFGEEMAPPGSSALAFEVAMDPGTDAWKQSDDSLIKDCLKPLIQQGRLQPKEVVVAFVVRQPFAYPILVRGYREKSQRLVDALSAVGNLVTLGRQGLFRYANQDECIEMALDVAPRIHAGDSAIAYHGDEAWRGVALPRMAEQGSSP